jgi:hypothetical protein
LVQSIVRRITCRSWKLLDCAQSGAPMFGIHCSSRYFTISPCVDRHLHTYHGLNAIRNSFALLSEHGVLYSKVRTCHIMLEAVALPPPEYLLELIADPST